MKNLISMKNCLYVLSISMFLLSCNEDNLNPDVSSDAKNSTNTKEHVCLDVFLPKDRALSYKDNATPGNSTNAGLLLDNKWQNGQVIRIKFLNGTPFLQSKVKQFANQWLKYANLKFEYVNADQNAEIRINFDDSNHSWSYIGKECLGAAPNSPTMNFGWFWELTSDNEFSRVVLHEFGHALGLIHEHQSPAAGIQWNREAVYKYYRGYPNYLSDENIEFNIFHKYSTTQTNYTAFDEKSIMLYEFPASFTLNGWSSGWNTVLSETDKSFIAQQYPGKVIPQETNNLYRYLLGNQHFYTSNYGELGNNNLEGILGEVYRSQAPDTYPIYRYYNTYSQDRLSTIEWNELRNGGQGSWVYEGITGYAYKTQHPNTIPVYRFFRGGNTPDHFFTININDAAAGGKNGYNYEGIAFYILK